MHLHTGTHMVAQLFGMSVNLDTIFYTMAYCSHSIYYRLCCEPGGVRSFQAVSRMRWK